MSSSRAAWILALFLALTPAASFAADEEGCLLCHRLPLREHPAAGRADLRVQEPPGGLHASLFCSDCHGDARVAPHPARPGPASCLGECHGGTPDRVASHRRASFGGLTEIHRRLSDPAAPCLLCHKGGDRPAAAASRCVGCHRRELATTERGVHGRIAGARESGHCAQCHRPHPPSVSGAETGPSCDGTGCHASVTPAMRRLSGHGSGERARGGGVAAVLVFASIASGGWLVGRLLGASRQEGDDR